MNLLKNSVQLLIGSRLIKKWIAAGLLACSLTGTAFADGNYGPDYRTGGHTRPVNGYGDDARPASRHSAGHGNRSHRIDNNPALDSWETDRLRSQNDDWSDVGSPTRRRLPIGSDLSGQDELDFQNRDRFDGRLRGNGRSFNTPYNDLPARNNGQRPRYRVLDDADPIDLRDSGYDRSRFDRDLPSYGNDRLNLSAPRDLFPNAPVNSFPSLTPSYSPSLMPNSQPGGPVLNRPVRPIDEVPDPVQLMSRRYQDRSVLSFLSTMDPQRGLTLYSEVLDMIQQRHLQPPTPQAMVQRAVQNLQRGMNNQAFLQANRLNMAQGQAPAFQQALQQLQGQAIQTNRDAVAAAQWTMQTAQQTVGLSANTVVLEFIYGAVESLDKFSAFVPPETARMTNQQLGESVVGIGVQIEAADAGVKVLKVLPNSPALSAGVQKGDLIVAVNGQSLNGLGLDGATSQITGPEGSSLTLSIQRAGHTASVQVVRRSVQVQSVTDVQFVDATSRIGYLKLETFASGSTREMQQALWQLHQQGMQGLVLDLRGDPGGLLQTAIELGNLFLTNGTIVSTRGRNSTDNSSETATPENTWKVPLVVVVDEHSASASEILAAAIQENRRGLIVGRTTYGKGTVQTLFPLNSLSAGLRLTTARFYSPNGKAMAGVGVTPDVEVPASGTDAAVNDRDVQTAVQVLRQQLSGQMNGNQNNGPILGGQFQNGLTNFDLSQAGPRLGR